MAEAQGFRNHIRFDPPFHFFLAPVLLINVLVALGVWIHHWPHHVWLHGWLVLLSVALLMMAGVARASALRAQDRVIRLEERLRYQALLGPADLAAVQELSLRQIIALRFASDAELPGLIRRALNEKMTPKAIKAAVVHWRPDHHRV